MNEALEKLNGAPRQIAETDFLNCCGSQNWARKTTDARPFETVAALLETAEQIWQSLEAKDWLEAFAAHPKIGALSAPSQSKQFAEWSHGEQSGARGADDATLADLAEANRLYELKFGFIFVVCATGKTANQMLEICRARLNNNVEAEIRAAAQEQQKITEIRLKKLLEIV